MGSRTVGTRPRPLQVHCLNLLPSCSKHRPIDLFTFSLQQSTYTEIILSTFVYASVAKALPYISVAVKTSCPAFGVEYGSGCFTGDADVIIHKADPSNVFCIHDSYSERTWRITDVESIRFTMPAVATEQANTWYIFVLLLWELDTKAEQNHPKRQWEVWCH